MITFNVRQQLHVRHHAAENELMEAGNIIHTEIEELRVKIYEQDQMVEMLKAAGFKHIRTIKAFDRSSAPTEQDEPIVYECRK